MNWNHHYLKYIMVKQFTYPHVLFSEDIFGLLLKLHQIFHNLITIAASLEPLIISF